MDFNWLHVLWFGYFVPSFWGNGPEALAQTVLYGAIALLFVPPIRRWMARHIQSVKDHVHAENIKVHERLAKAERDRKHHEELLHHIIRYHPDIPEFGAEPKPKKAVKNDDSGNATRVPPRKARSSTKSV